MMPIPPPTGSVVVLSGAGLSVASGIPTFRGADGLWEGHEVTQVATPEAWHRDATLVRQFYDERRLGVESVQPNPGHAALAQLQEAWGAERVVLITQNIDGLLQRAGAPDVIEMHGSLFRLQCERDPRHPTQPAQGEQDPEARCERCGGRMRPAVVWFGEMPRHMDRIQRETSRCEMFLSVGTSGLVYPAAGLVRIARRAGARCVEINPEPSGGPFHTEIPEGSETALPRIVDAWLG